jgi:putative MATE family efflux protein
MAAAGGAVLTAVNVAGADWLLAAMGLRGESAEYGAQWLRITGWVWVPAAVNMIGAACLRGAGDTRTPMWIMAAVNVLNLGLALALTFGFGPIPAMGAVGIAIGTAVARAVGGAALAVILVVGWAKLCIPITAMPQEAGLLRRVLRVAGPAAAEFLFGAAAMVLYYRIVGKLGDVAVAAHSVAVRTEGLSYLPGWGFAVAAGALVGQNLGAGRPGCADRAARQAFRAGGAVMMAMAVVFAVAGEPLIAVFAPGQDEVIAQGGAALRIVSLAQLGQAATFIFCGALRGAGDTRYPLLVTLVGLFAVRLPFTWLLAITWEMGLAGVWAAMVLDLTVRGAMAAWRFLRGGWKSVTV